MCQRGELNHSCPTECHQAGPIKHHEADDQQGPWQAGISPLPCPTTARLIWIPPAKLTITAADADAVIEAHLILAHLCCQVWWPQLMDKPVEDGGCPFLSDKVVMLVGIDMSHRQRPSQRPSGLCPAILCPDLPAISQIERAERGSLNVLRQVECRRRRQAPRDINRCLRGKLCQSDHRQPAVMMDSAILKQPGASHVAHYKRSRCTWLCSLTDIVVRRR